MKKGQSMVEYIIISVIVLVLIYFAIQQFGHILEEMLNTVNSSLSGI